MDNYNKCVRCNKTKEGKHFHKDSSSKNLLYSTCKECDRKRSKDWIRKNPEEFLWRLAKRRSEKKNIPFNISVKDIKIPKKCPVLGINLFRNGKKRQGPNSPTLDRIDNKKGYVKGNIVIVSWRANNLKGSASLKEMYLLYKFYRNLKMEKKKKHGRNKY